ncbi:hypothetical protein ACIRD9_42605 [Streptomyces violaceus]|uniref:hypothetical protein n=1 Tax=Streptomyces violaceus TaxID=1936 RepID=UPI003813E31F
MNDDVTPLAPIFCEPVDRPVSPPPVDVQHDRPDDAPERDAEAVDATPAAATPPPDASTPDGPVPIAAGTYAVYDDQDGGFVLVLGTREGQTHHKHVPARVVKMAEMAMGGNSPLAAMFGAA